MIEKITIKARLALISYIDEFFKGNDTGLDIDSYMEQARLESENNERIANEILRKYNEL